MATYSNEELFEMIMIYAECNRNNSETARVFERRFPNSRKPNKMFIYRLITRLKRTGSLHPRPGPGRNRQYSEDQIIDILAYFGMNPHGSVRAASSVMNIPPTTIWRVLRENKWHPYCVHGLQALKPSDYVRRLDFCNWLLIQHTVNSQFVSNILWTDECLFTEDGAINSRNDHYWNNTNPFFVREIHHQQRFSVSVWCGIWNNVLVGPVFYQGTLTGDRYHDLILKVAVENFMENTVPLKDFNHVWFQHDGAPPHNSQVASNYINTEFGNRWIGLNGPIEWPPRSPDLTPLDFYLWGRIRALVYVQRPLNIQDLCARITIAFQSITHNELKNVSFNILRRAQLCIGADSRHFETVV